MTSKLRNQFLVDRSGYAFFVGIEFKILSSFSMTCMNIGHATSNCIKRMHSGTVNNTEQKASEYVAKPKVVSKYVPKLKEIHNENSK